MYEISVLDASMAALRLVAWANAAVAVALFVWVMLWLVYSVRESERHLR